MQIFVKSRLYVMQALAINYKWVEDKWIISIFDKGYYSPIPVDLPNVLKLEFDDVTERENYDDFLHFNDELADKIVEFIKPIDKNDERPFYVHCAAGISRSGAVGYMLNEWFNKYLTINKSDDQMFRMNNNHIMPNPEVIRILKRKMFGTEFLNNC